MTVDEALISRLEKLARLQLDPAERQRLGADLERIVDFVSRLQQLDTTGVDPLVYLTDSPHATGWRDDDTVGPHLPREQVLNNAPAHDDAYFHVPKVIE